MHTEEEIDLNKTDETEDRKKRKKRKEERRTEAIKKLKLELNQMGCIISITLKRRK